MPSLIKPPPRKPAGELPIDESRQRRLEAKRKYYSSHKQLWKDYFIKNKVRLIAEKKVRRQNNLLQYRETDRKRMALQRKNKTSWQDRHRDKYRAMLLKYRSRPEALEKARLAQARVRKENPEYIKQYVKNRMANDEEFRACIALRKTVSSALRRRNIRKTTRAMILLGCEPKFLKKYIESLFLPGMSWANYGRDKGCWHIDHKRPCASFNLTDLEQQKLCFNWTNLQPLWWIDNIRKGDKIPEYA